MTDEISDSEDRETFIEYIDSEVKFFIKNIHDSSLHSTFQPNETKAIEEFSSTVRDSWNKVLKVLGEMR